MRAKFDALAPTLNERSRRVWAAAEAVAIGHGGIALVARATGMSPTTIARGRQGIRSGRVSEPKRIRRPGGGRKRQVDRDPQLRLALQQLVDPVTRGDPQSSLGWTSLSTRRLAKALRKAGHSTSHRMVAVLLQEMGYSLQANRKTKEGTAHPDRDAQFQYINRCAGAQMAAGQPVISVDTKKKELVGDFKNGGLTAQPICRPSSVT